MEELNSDAHHAINASTILPASFISRDMPEQRSPISDVGSSTKSKASSANGTAKVISRECNLTTQLVFTAVIDDVLELNKATIQNVVSGLFSGLMYTDLMQSALQINTVLSGG